MLTPELTQYIKATLAQGFSREDIRKTLLDVQWSEEDIDQAFSLVAQQERTEQVFAAPPSRAIVPAASLFFKSPYRVFLLFVVAAVVAAAATSVSRRAQYLARESEIFDAYRNVYVAQLIRAPKAAAPILVRDLRNPSGLLQTIQEAGKSAASGDALSEGEPESALPAPRNLLPLSGNGLVDLAWDPIFEENLKEYRLYRSVTPEEGYKRVAATKESFYLDKKVENDTLYYYRVTAVDSDGGESDFSEAASVVPKNHPPILNPIGDKTVDEGKLLGFALSAVEVDDEPVHFSILSGLPRGASFDEQTGVFTWIPRYDQAGAYEIHFEASDGALADDEEIMLGVADKETGAPTVHIFSNKTSVSANEPFDISVIASSPYGVKTIWWFGDKTGKGSLDSAHWSDAGGAFIYNATWDKLKIDTPGIYRFKADARDILHPGEIGDKGAHQASDAYGHAVIVIEVKE